MKIRTYTPPVPVFTPVNITIELSTKEEFNLLYAISGLDQIIPEEFIDGTEALQFLRSLRSALKATLK